MKPLIVYFSFSGNNRLLAEYLSKELAADICPIIETKKRSEWTLLFDVMFKRSPKINDLEKPLKNYEHVIFLAPLWAGRIASPLKSLLLKEKESLKKYSFLSLCGGYEHKDQMEKVTQELTTLTGKSPAGVFEIDISDLFPKEKKKEIKTISAYHVKPEDLVLYQNQLKKITDFLSSP